MNIGVNIRNTRKEKGLSQVAVSQKAGIAVNSLRLYEAGKRQPSWDALQKISDALGVTLWELLESGASQTESPNETDKQKEKQHGNSEQAIRAPTDDDILKMNCTAVSSYMEKMNPVGQAVAVQTVKTLADMPEYQKKDEPAQK